MASLGDLVVESLDFGGVGTAKVEVGTHLETYLEAVEEALASVGFVECSGTEEEQHHREELANFHLVFFDC